MDPTAPPELPNLGGSLAVMLLSLGFVCLLAWVALRWLGRRGVGQGTGPIRVLARCPLEPRRTVYLLEAGGRCFLVGAAEGGMNLISEVERSAVEVPLRSASSAQPLGGARFAEVLARLGSMARQAGGAARRSVSPGQAGALPTVAAPPSITATTTVITSSGRDKSGGLSTPDPEPTTR